MYELFKYLVLGNYSTQGIFRAGLTNNESLFVSQQLLMIEKHDVRRADCELLITLTYM